MRNSKILLLGAVFVLAFSAVLITGSLSDSDASDHSGDVLFDKGNGDIRWFEASGSGTVSDVIVSTLNSNGHQASVSGTVLTVDGKSTYTVGTGIATTDDVINNPGTSAVTVTSTWIVYKWTDGRWEPVTNLSTQFEGTYAVGFYPSGTVPAETPYHQSITCMGNDSTMQYYMNASVSSDKPEFKWGNNGMHGVAGSYSQPLTANGYVFVKYGYGMKAFAKDACLSCMDLYTGEEKWYFFFPTTYYEVNTSAIVGDYIYVQSSFGKIYKINYKTAEGDMTNSYEVTTFYGAPAPTSDVTVPNVVPEGVDGKPNADGLTTITYNSGTIVSKGVTGLIYCFDLDLNPIWSCQTYGVSYTYGATIDEDYVYAGQFNGHLYIINKQNGQLLYDQLVYEKVKESKGKITRTGSVCPIAVLKHNGETYLGFTYNDGLVMSSTIFGIAIYKVVKGDNVYLEEVKKVESELGSVSGYVTPIVIDDFAGYYFSCNKDSTPTVARIDLSGEVEVLSTGNYVTHAALVNIEGKYLAATSYNKGQPLMQFDFEGKRIGEFWIPDEFTDFCMTNAIFIDGYYFGGNDVSVYFVEGGFDEPKNVDPVDPVDSSNLWLVIGIVAGIVIVLLAIYLFLRFVKGWEQPFSQLKDAIGHFLYGEDYTHNTLRRHRLWLVMGVGIILTLILALVSLCLGPTSMMSPGEMFSALFSAIGKGGQNLNYNELMVYSARLPRTLVALAVGIGLSIAGAMYQAIIRNPLVDPYIMGVSSGAGTAAIAVIAFNFTFFGLFPSHSIYLTAIAAALGGIIAFGCTMVLANKSGGSSVNYVLAGVIVGLVFGAAQTLMLTFAGDQVSGALSWLYGSFAEITWSKVWIVLVPALAISFSALFWAREFNLVLLGEDQAKQMGLNVKKFNMVMLTLASILTAICVAFCGIIGFVGLVIPHLCRMMLGGDHRLVLPASMAFGGFLMIAADLLSRMLIIGFELPVGAITTIIGVPVFAWLLIKRGKMYDG